MKLYHGSNTEIRFIDLDKCKPYKDFGRGFYLTEIAKQAELMAKRTAAIYGGVPIVTAFHYDAEAAMLDRTLSIKRFNAPDEEWALFVMANRNRKPVTTINTFDIVTGPVADDSIATLFRNFDEGIIDLAALTIGLRYKKLSSQYMFSSFQAVAYLKRL